MAYLFEELLVPLAEEAGIKVPEDLTKFNELEYPHWTVFKIMQLGAALPYPDAGWYNARVVASIKDEYIFKITPAQLYEMGFAVGRRYLA